MKQNNTSKAHPDMGKYSGIPLNASYRRVVMQGSSFTSHSREAILDSVRYVICSLSGVPIRY